MRLFSDFPLCIFCLNQNLCAFANCISLHDNWKNGNFLLFRFVQFQRVNPLERFLLLLTKILVCAEIGFCYKSLMLHIWTMGIITLCSFSVLRSLVAIWSVAAFSMPIFSKIPLKLPFSAVKQRTLPLFVVASNKFIAHIPDT